MVLATFATDESLLTHFNAPATMINLGRGREWHGFIDRLIVVYEFLRTLDDDTVFCFTDAYDAICLVADEDEVVAKFREYGVDVLFSAETNCYPWPHVREMYPHSPTPYRYLNAGGFVGRVRALREMIKGINEQINTCPCDQAYFTYYFINYIQGKVGKGLKIALDVYQRIFQTGFGISWNSFVVRKGRIYNKDMRTRPCFLHFNGKYYETADGSSIIPIIYKTLKRGGGGAGGGEWGVIQKYPVFWFEGDSRIKELAKEAARRYKWATQSQIRERHNTNFHAIFDLQKKDFIGPVDHGNVHQGLIRDFVAMLPLEERKGGFLLDISLHDYVGYQMNDAEWPHSILGFSTDKGDRHNILIPDLYAMQGYKGVLDKVMVCERERKKKNAMLFIGSSTGRASMEENARVKLCRWSQGRDWIQAYISEYVNFKGKGYERNAMTVEEQLEWKHLICVDGNTACWDRLPWILASKSVCWKLESSHQCWYYPFLKPWVHYVPFTMETLEETWLRVKDDVEVQERIIQAANHFVEEFLRPRCHALYFATLLNEI